MQEDDLGATVLLFYVLFDGIDSDDEGRSSGNDPARLFEQSRRVTGGRGFNGLRKRLSFCSRFTRNRFIRSLLEDLIPLSNFNHGYRTSR